MKADWSPAQCIICLDNGPLCEEHLIPHSIGGILTCPLLCQSCNSNLGHRVDATAKHDPSILLAVRELRNELPLLHQRLIESHRHVSLGEAPCVRGFIRDRGVSGYRPNDVRAGHWFCRPRRPPMRLGRCLHRQGSSASNIDAALDRFDAMPTNRRTNIAPGLDVISRTPVGIELDLSQGKLLNSRLPAKIAVRVSRTLWLAAQSVRLSVPLQSCDRCSGLVRTSTNV